MNYENFCKVLARIEANPWCWDQQSFFGNCFVGLAADMAGISRNAEPCDRLLTGALFLGLAGNCPEVAAAGLPLDHFRRIRYIEGTRRFMARA